MAIQLNHTIVWAKDGRASADFLAGLFDLPSPKHWGHFYMVEVSNDITLDYSDYDGEVQSQHYAFLVSEDEFDQIFGRIQAQGVTHWADPGHHQPGRINTRDGGRGVYFEDPNGHNMEIITRPYGSGG
jgi:catechol 2,3-dioxygenase-like lactoylglutathione lyase family enzyme